MIIYAMSDIHGCLQSFDCVKDIGKRNTEDSSKSKDELIEEGDSYCKICNP